MPIERLTPIHASQYRELMLEAYAAHPDAFLSTPAERADLPLSWWERRLAPGDNPGEIVLAELRGDRIAGAVGLGFEQREKARHKAGLFGMVVAEPFRCQGIGHLLVQAALEEAGRRAGIMLVQLTVTQRNQSALALYERCGFIQFGLEPFAAAVGDGYISKIHMWRRVGTEVDDEQDE